MINKKYVYTFVALATLATLTAGVPAFAATSVSGTSESNWSHAGGNSGRTMKPGVFGTVSAISGNIITVTGKQGFGVNAPTTAVTYTVDATNAKIMKNNVAGTVSSIVVGDTIMAQGTLTGTNLVATNIRDGVMMRGNGSKNGTGVGTNQPSPITGNGQPVVAGAVTSVNGGSIVITNKSNVSYTVDATNAKIVQGQNTISISNIAVGDMLVVQGTVNGNTVTASSVIDQKVVSSTTTGTTTPSKGFFGSIGSFFARIFGF